MIIPLDKEKVYLKFKEPQIAITPGQTVVFYGGDTVIGSGIIEKMAETGPEKQINREVIEWLK